MKKINIDKQDLLFFIHLGCSNVELAEVFDCSVRLIANKKKEFDFIGITQNNNTTQVVDGIRQCKKCLKYKNIENFNKQTNAKSGTRSTCKTCQSSEAKVYYKEHREHKNQVSRQHYNSNKDLYLLKYHKRRAQKYKAIPLWYSELDDLILKELYSQAKDLYKITSVIYEIDHILPLQGNKVCGLHYATNWQLLPRCTNRWKSNKLLEKHSG